MKKKKNILISLLCLIVCFTKAQPINQLVQEAINNNLELKVIEQEYLTALERAPQVSQRPDPEIGVGVFPLPIETRLGPQIMRVGATQMLPWKGVLDSKKDLELAKAKTLYERVGVRSLELVYQIKKAWYQLYELEQSQRIIERNLLLLESLDRLALAKVESGKATAADVLSVQLKTEELKQEILLLEKEKSNPTTVINQLLNRALDIPIDVKDNLSFAQLPFYKDSLVAAITGNHPLIRFYELQQEVAQQAVAVSKLSDKPMIGVGLDYMMVNKRDGTNIPRNGRDIIQVRASVNIPLNKAKYEAKEREEAIRIATLEAKKEDAVSQFLALIEQAYTDYEMAQLRMTLYEQQIKITQSAITMLESNYSATGRDFDKLLRLEMELIEYDLKILKAIVQSHLAKSLIEKFVDF